MDKEILKIPNYDLVSWKLKLNKLEIPSIELDLKLNLRNIASVTGDRLLLEPNVLNKWTYVPPRSFDRKTPVSLNETTKKIDNITFNLPKGVFVEQTLNPVEIDSDFGSYKFSSSNKENQFSYNENSNFMGVDSSHRNMRSLSSFYEA